MKPIIFVTLFFVFQTTGFAQSPPDHSAQCREKMKPLMWMAGRWTGEASVSQGPGKNITVRQDEFVEARLDSTLLIVEGKGYSPENPDKIVFNALAALHFNPLTQQYSLRSYLKEGSSTDAYFTVLEADTYEWGFDTPNGGKVRYTITTENEKKTWKEKGEYSPDGQTWYPFMSMQLEKIK